MCLTKSTYVDSYSDRNIIAYILIYSYHTVLIVIIYIYKLFKYTLQSDNFIVKETQTNLLHSSIFPSLTL